MVAHRSVSLVSNSSTESIQSASDADTDFGTAVHAMDGAKSQLSVIKLERDGNMCTVDDVSRQERARSPLVSGNEICGTSLTMGVSETPSSAERVIATKVSTSTIGTTDDCKGYGESEKISKKKTTAFTDTSDEIAEIAACSENGSRRRKRPRVEPVSSISQSFVTTNHPPTIVTTSMSNHYAPPRMINGTWVAKNSRAGRKSNSDGNKVEGQPSDEKNRVSVHMLNSVGLECGEDGALLLERFDDDEETSRSSMFDSGCAQDIMMKTEGNARGDENIDPSPMTKAKQPAWTLAEHRAFAAAIFEIGLKNCSPSVIMENMRKQPRYITRERTKSHLQKYRQTKERSKGEFLKEYDSFFSSIDKAKKNLGSSSCDTAGKLAVKKTNKEPIHKAILTTTLEGKKPNKLLGGKVAALLSYSVINGFSTKYGPDQLQYRAAKLTEFPKLTEDEKLTSVGASLLQVKTLIDNMTDVLLKARHGIDPNPQRRGDAGEDDSDSSSDSSFEDGYSDDDDDNGELSGKSEKRVLDKSISKDVDHAAPVPDQRLHGGPFPVGGLPPGQPLYPGGPTTYPPGAYPLPGAPPPVATVYPPPQYPHAPPTYYGGAHPPPAHLPVAGAPGYGHSASYPPPPPVHFPQDPRMNLYQQPPPGQVATFASASAPPMQSNYYPGIPGYPGYYGTADHTGSHGNQHMEYPHAQQNPVSSSEHYGNQSRPIAPQSSPPNKHQHHKRSFDLTDESTSKKKERRRGETRSSRRKRHDDDFKEFLERIVKVPSPTKAQQQSSSPPIQQSRDQERFVMSSMTPLVKTSRKRSREHLDSHDQNRHNEQDFETNSQSFAKAFESPFSESEVSHYSSPQNQTQHHGRQQQAPSSLQRTNHGQFWDASTILDPNFNNQQDPQNSRNGGDFLQQPAQPDPFPDQGVIHNPNQQGKFEGSNSYSSPAGDSAGKYFFGD